MFCSNCGTKLNEGAKFCHGCGFAVGATKIPATPTTSKTSVATATPAKEGRDIHYDGKVYKCPVCGEIMASFISICPSCGHEIRGAAATSVVHDLSLKLDIANSVTEKEELIRNFYIPNTREDMVALVCDICGGKLIMQTEALIECESCGMKYSKARMQEKIQEIRGTVKVDGPIETVQGNAEKERLLKNADTFIQIGDFEKSEALYREVTDQYPEDYRGWFGLLTYYCKYCSDIPEEYPFFRPALDLFNKICNYANTIVTLTKDRDVFDTVVTVIRAFWERIAETNPRYCFEALTKGYDNLKVFMPNFMELYEEAKGYEKTKERFNALDQGVRMWIPKLFGYSNVNNLHQQCTYVFRNHFGLREMIYHDDVTPEEVSIKTPYPLDTIIDRISCGVCVHCGGGFKGIFKITCSQCGKPIDYPSWSR